jgi:hypothetical protein
VDSALSRFLLRRALTKPRLIGHIYYWLLQSEVYNADVSKRYVILLQVRRYFSVCLFCCAVYINNYTMNGSIHCQLFC